ncbi:MAG: glycosyltransferase family 2 protein [Oceanicaulis sp.]
MTDVNSNYSTENNMISIKISVVIPVYNNSKLARSAIASVIRQTSPAEEIILSNDGSNEIETARIEILKNRFSKFVRIIHVNPGTNSGPGTARHLGADAAIGEYVAFLDADDLWHRDKLAIVSELIQKEKPSLLGHDQPWSTTKSAELIRRPITNKGVRRLGFARFLVSNPIKASAIVAESSLARCMFRFGGRHAEDYLGLIVAAKQSVRTVYINAPLCFARKPPFGVTGQGSDLLKLYKASYNNIIFLRGNGIVSNRDYLIFIFFLAVRTPIGQMRYLWVRLRSHLFGGNLLRQK